MDTRRLLLAALLSLAVMLIWGYLFPPQPPPERGAPAPEPVRPEPVRPEPVRPEPVRPEGGPEISVEGVAEEAEGAPEPELAPWEPAEAAAEERSVVEGEDFRAEFSNRGAQLIAFELRDHPDGAGGKVNLVRSRAAPPYPFGLTDAEGGSSPLNGVLFEVEEGVDEEGRKSLSFRYAGGAGAAEKRFAFRSDGLIEVEVEVPGRTDWGLALGPGVRNPTPEELASRFARRTAVYRVGDRTEQVDPQRADGAALLPGGGLLWVGVQDTYFLSALVPREGVAEVRLQPMLRLPGDPGRGERYRPLPPAEELSAEEEAATREMLLLLRPRGDRLSAVAYLGPKEYERLAELPFGLETTVELGWFRFLSLPLLKGIRWIHGHVVANYGWAIILMTVLIRILLFPLTHKSTVSMQKMQKLNPQVQAIRQKYRAKLKDKKGRPNVEVQRKMNEEMMALYKSEGVNPAGGCVPMLLQIPVLFAFYNILSAAIELRHAPWILWIQDLSVKDPYYVLPIVMGASQFLQQKMTPPAGDPMQRRIFALMPIFFTVLFLGFPSGLVLYWLTNNLLGIAQQAAYKRIRERAEADSGKADSGRQKQQPSSGKSKRG